RGERHGRKQPHDQAGVVRPRHAHPFSGGGSAFTTSSGTPVVSGLIGSSVTTIVVPAVMSGRTCARNAGGTVTRDVAVGSNALACPLGTPMATQLGFAAVP